jgi:Flp pilus assembly pilin Flp
MRKLFGHLEDGQSILEYAILIAVLCVVFVTMTVYVRRSVQAKMMVVQNRVNEAVK